jgi:hypothetical protein
MSPTYLSAQSFQWASTIIIQQTCWSSTKQTSSSSHWKLTCSCRHISENLLSKTTITQMSEKFQLQRPINNLFISLTCARSIQIVHLRILLMDWLLFNVMWSAFQINSWKVQGNQHWIIIQVERWEFWSSQIKLKTMEHIALKGTTNDQC